VEIKKFIMKKIIILILSFIGITNQYANDLIKISVNEHHAIIDFHGSLETGSGFRLEAMIGNDFQVIGHFQKPANLQSFTKKYQSLALGFPSLAIHKWSEKELGKLWEEKAHAVVLSDMEPFKDRVLLSAWGFTTLINKAQLSNVKHWRLMNMNGEVLSSMPTIAIQEVVWPAVKPRGYEALEEASMASWQCPYQGDILGFKVYRSIEFAGAYEEVPVAKSLSVDQDTMIFIMRDTTSDRPGLYQYRITLLDIAGNESPPSYSFRLPNLQKVPYPEAYVYATGLDSIRAIRVDWRISNPERIRTVELQRRFSKEDEFTQIAILSPKDSTYLDFVPKVRDNYNYRIVLHDLILTQPIYSIPVFSVSLQEEAAFANIRMEQVDSNTTPTIRIAIDEEMYLQGFYIFHGKNYEPSDMNQVSDFIPYTGESPIIWKDTSSYGQSMGVHAYTLTLVSDGFVKTPLKDTIFITRMDKPELPEPIIFRMQLDEKQTGTIAWHLKPYEKAQVRHFNVFKVSGTKKERTLIQTVDAQLNYLKIPKADPGVFYQVQAVHWMGAEGPLSSPVQLQEISNPVRGPEALWLKIEKSNPVICWVPTTDHRIKQFEVYRMLDNQKKSEKIATLTANESTYTDKTQISRGGLSYWVVPVLMNGTKSNASEILYISHE
jgi:hypothetical protein